MRSKYYAVIDTNVIVSALISKTLDSNPVKVIKAIALEQIVPLYNDEILAEYREVLSREKFGLDGKIIELLLQTIQVDGESLDRTIADGEQFPDEKDIVFYEVALSKEDSFLVTGNVKHFPSKAFVITPAQMVEMISESFPV